MKTILALTMILAGMNAMAATYPEDALSSKMSGIVTDLPKDPTGVDLVCVSSTGKTGLFAAMPGDLKGTAVVISVNDEITADVDADYVKEAQARSYDVQKELQGVQVTNIKMNDKGDLATSRFSLNMIPGTKKSHITNGGQDGTIRFQANLSTRGMKNIRVSCTQEWAL